MAVMSGWLHRIFIHPIFENEEKTRVAQILNRFLWSAIGILFTVVVIRAIFWVENGSLSLLILSMVIILLGGVQVLIRLGYVRGASMFLVGALWVAMAFQAWAADGVRDVAAIAFLIIILLAGLLLGWREAL